MRLRVLRGVTGDGDADPAGDEVVVPIADVAAWLRDGPRRARVRAFSEARLIAPELGVLERPLASAMLLRVLSRGGAWLEDVEGSRVRVNAPLLARYAARFARDAARAPLLLRRVAREVAAMERAAMPAIPSLDLSGTAVYCRTDLWFGVRAGGSVAHVAGVANALGEFTGGPLLLTTDRIPTVRDRVAVVRIRPDGAFRDFGELPSIGFDATFVDAARRAIGGRRVSFVYQRLSAFSRAGATLARTLGVPLVVEYNGSAAWMSRHWGRPLRHERLAERTERVALRAATLVVVGSAALRETVRACGVADDAILVNPNGVDPDAYHPAVDGAAVRERLGLGDATVIGFIGTFGAWHGAELLADAFGRVWRDAAPARRDGLRLLMIGDGPRGGAARAALAAHGAQSAAVFTGVVPQEDGPAHLAACDVLVSPQVPNADGTPFFGSPTKLFEYMAMGKAVLASRLDQIGEVVEHGASGWLVEPGSAAALADGLRALVADPALRQRLGAQARRVAVERHTWRAHTGRIVDALRERCP